ncbi:MAG: cytochrome o ubiquinol oxidase subunit IV [Pseudomonadota bacterium]
MSAAAHEHHDDHDDDGLGGMHVTLRDYAVGFVLAVVLTVIPFWIVMTRAIESSGWTITVILAFAAVQIVVHMIYFLHMTPKSEGGWSMMALVFTVVLVVITLSGSLWIMYHLDANMMPPTAEQMRNAP